MNKSLHGELQKISLFDFDFISADNIEAIVEPILRYREHPDYVSGAKSPFVVTPNAYQIVQFDDRRYADLKLRLKQALFILPDGQPIVWSSAFMNSERLKARLAGSDLFPQLWKSIKNRSEKTLFVLSSEKVASALRKEYANSEYYVAPFFQQDDLETVNMISDYLADHIVKNQPKFVFLGLGYPKQELIGLSIWEKLQQQGVESPLMFFLGASFEFYTGQKKRAPEVWQKYGLEWGYRFIQEPKRTWRRYLLGNVKFLMIVLKQLGKAGS